MTSLFYIMIFVLFILGVAVVSFLYYMKRPDSDLLFVGGKLDNSEDAIADAMKYFVLMDYTNAK